MRLTTGITGTAGAPAPLGPNACSEPQRTDRFQAPSRKSGRRAKAAFFGMTLLYAGRNRIAPPGR